MYMMSTRKRILERLRGLSQLSVRLSVWDSGHDLTVHGFKPCTGLWADGAEPAWDSLSLPPSLPLPHSLSLKIIIIKKDNNLKTTCLYHTTL